MLLLSDASVCIFCGALVSAASGDEYKTTVRSAAGAPNRISFKETRGGRSLEATFTNEAVDGISAHLAALLTTAVPGRTDRPRIEFKPNAGVPADQLPLTTLQRGDATPVDAIDVPHRIRDDSLDTRERERLGRIFLREGDKLLLHDTRLKARNKRNFVARLVCLFVYTHDLNSHPSVTRASVSELLKTRGLNDGNARRWIANCDELIRFEDTLRLAALGRELAKTALSEIFDSSVPDTWTLSAGSRPRARATANGDGSKTSDQRTKASQSGAQPRKEAIALAGAWKERFSGTVGHSAVFGKPLADQGMIGLWAIRRIDSGERATVSRKVLADFIALAFDVNVSDRNLERALKTEGENTGRVRNVTGTSFRITDGGVQYVESQLVTVSMSNSSSNGHVHSN